MSLFLSVWRHCLFIGEQERGVFDADDGLRSIVSLSCILHHATPLTCTLLCPYPSPAPHYYQHPHHATHSSPHSGQHLSAHPLRYR